MRILCVCVLACVCACARARVYVCSCVWVYVSVCVVKYRYETIIDIFSVLKLWYYWTYYLLEPGLFVIVTIRFFPFSFDNFDLDVHNSNLTSAARKAIVRQRSPTHSSHWECSRQTTWNKREEKFIVEPPKIEGLLQLNTFSVVSVIIISLPISLSLSLSMPIVSMRAYFTV